MKNNYELFSWQKAKNGLLALALSTASVMSYGQWTENFDAGTSLPTGWAVIEGGSTDRTWKVSNDVDGDAQSGTNAASIYYHLTEAHDDYLVTKEISVQAGVSDRISLSVRSRAGSYKEPYKVWLSTTTQELSAFTVVLQEEQEAPEEWLKLEFDLSAYVGQTVYVAVQATGTNEWELYADDFVVDALPTCLKPTDVMVENVTQNTADLSWSAPSTVPANGYDVYYSTVNTAPTDADVPQFTGVTGTNQQLTGLALETTYYVWVRSNCDASDASEWVQSMFETLPNPPSECTTVTASVDSDCGNLGVDLSWSSVEGATGYRVVVGTTAGGNDVLDNYETSGLLASVDFSSVSTTYYYTVTPFNAAGDAQGCTEGSVTTVATACYCPSLPTSNDGDGITNTKIKSTDFEGSDVTYQDFTATPVDVEQGEEVAVDITFSTGYTYDTHIWVDWNKNFEFEDSEKVFTGIATSVKPNILSATLTVPADATDGQYRMRIGSADSGQYFPNPCYSSTFGVTVDATLNVTSSLSTTEVNVSDLDGVKLYPNPFKDVVNISNVRGVESIQVVDMAGRLVRTMKPASQINLGDLNSGMYLINLSYEDGSVKTLKAIKK